MARILIVDDDPDIVESVTMVLQKNNHEVLQAYGGVEGLEKAKKEKPDAIILDVMMPDKDGYEVCKELKGDAHYRDIPILLLTAVVSQIPSTTYTHRMGMETEADDYVDKPVEPTELARLVERLLKQ
jgi:two-component system alkaline phosphatase synthesis response regulator PhoP